jgi:hypothetical protein
MEIVLALLTLGVVFAVPTAIVCWLVAKPNGPGSGLSAPVAPDGQAPHS